MKGISILFLFCFFQKAWTQKNNDFYFQASTYSFGGGIGFSHYQGDLNPDFSTLLPGWSASVYAKKHYNNYVALRYQLMAANFGYASQYASNEWRKSQNLSFQTNVLEFAIQGDFHFFRYMPTVYDQNFTPYISLGLGVFYFNPYTYYKGNKYYLRDYKTEGVSYLPVGFSVPLGIGIKWGVNKYLNMGIELIYRELSTDRLDDVSENYIATSSNEITNFLSDRSEELGIKKMGLQDKQRGLSNANDNFLTLQIYLSFNIYKYYCP